MTKQVVVAEGGRLEWSNRPWEKGWCRTCFLSSGGLNGHYSLSTQRSGFQFNFRRRSLLRGFSPYEKRYPEERMPSLAANRVSFPHGTTSPPRSSSPPYPPAARSFFPGPSPSFDLMTVLRRNETNKEKVLLGSVLTVSTKA